MWKVIYPITLTISFLSMPEQVVAKDYTVDAYDKYKETANALGKEYTMDITLNDVMHYIVRPLRGQKLRYRQSENRINEDGCKFTSTRDESISFNAQGDGASGFLTVSGSGCDAAVHTSAETAWNVLVFKLDQTSSRFGICLRRVIVSDGDTQDYCDFEILNSGKYLQMWFEEGPKDNRSTVIRVFRPMIKQ